MRPWLLASALLAAVAVWMWIPRDGSARVRRLFDGQQARRQSRLPVLRLAALAGACGALVALPIPINIGAAVAVWILVPRLASRLESGDVRRERAHLARQAPVVADLLAATSASGATVARSVAAIHAAVGDPAARYLSKVEAALSLGADPAEAFRPLLDDASLAPIAQAVSRSMRTGAPLSGVLARIADDLRRAHSRDVEIAARSAGVRAVAPLAVCFLPAFMLLGVVPVIASLATGVFG